MILNIETEPSTLLRKKCEEVSFDSENSNYIHGVEKLMSDMVETMYYNNGVGLAAPQVGINKRIIVMDRGPNYGFSTLKMINPVIISKSEQLSSLNEGCLSVPGFDLDIVRPDSVLVSFSDHDGQNYNVELHGVNSHIVQHEIDHLDGVTILKRASRLKRDIYLKKQKKKLRLKNTS